MKTADVMRWSEIRNSDTSLLDESSESSSLLDWTTAKASIETGWTCPAVKQRATSQVKWTTLGEIAECRTGIYTGDNIRFLGFDPNRATRRLNGHPIHDWNANVYIRPLTSVEAKFGLTVTPSYVPLIRGGHRTFSEQTSWAIRWDAESVNFYKTNEKARLQNSKFYFQRGLAVPMVTSQRLSASLMENAIFDQGVVGVFPHNPDKREALLLYLNSSTASKFRHDLVNGGANNSANYLKRLPVPRITSLHLQEAKSVVDKALNSGILSQSVCDEYVAWLLSTMPSKPSNPNAVIASTDRNQATSLFAS